MKMIWNYRVIATPLNKNNSVIEKDIQFAMYEVYYDDGEPVSYTVEEISPLWFISDGYGGESPREELKWVLNKMLESLDKPILWAGSKFPEEYKTED